MCPKTRSFQGTWDLVPHSRDPAQRTGLEVAKWPCMETSSGYPCSDHSAVVRAGPQRSGQFGEYCGLPKGTGAGVVAPSCTPARLWDGSSLQTVFTVYKNKAIGLAPPGRKEWDLLQGEAPHPICQATPKLSPGCQGIPGYPQ